MSGRLSLFEVSDWMQEVAAKLEASEGVLDEPLEAEFDRATAAYDDKVAQWVYVIREFEATAAAYEAEEKRLAERKRVAAGTAKRMRETMQMVLERDGKERAGTTLAGARLQPNSRASITLLDGDASTLPPTLTRAIPARIELDVAAVELAMKEGALPEDVAARFEIVRRRHLRLT